MDTITIELPGEPRGWSRPRARLVTPKSGQQFITVFKDAKTRKFERDLGYIGKAAMRGKRPLDCALAIEIIACFSVPKSWTRRDRDAALAGTIRPTGRPDVDNVMKMVDGLNEIVWVDDSKIVQATVAKHYGERPYFRVVVTPLLDAGGLPLESQAPEMDAAE